MPNLPPSSQLPLAQSTVSISTVASVSDYSTSSNELYHIIGGTISKNQVTSFQQLANAIGPIDINTLEIGQNVLLSSQENINFIHEIFRQVNLFCLYDKKCIYVFIYFRVILCPVKMV